MLSVLKKLKQTHEIAEFYTNGETDVFEVGNIVALNDKIFAYRYFSMNGDQIGIVAYPVEDVFQVQTKTQYVEKIKKLRSDDDYSGIEKEIDESNIFASLLEIALKRKEIISGKLIGNNDYNFIGFIESIDGDELKCKIIDEYGYDDGYCYAKISDITELAFMTEKERRYYRLWKINAVNQK